MFGTRLQPMIVTSFSVGICALILGFGVTSPDPTKPVPAEPLIVFKTIGAVCIVYAILLTRYYWRARQR